MGHACGAEAAVQLNPDLQEPLLGQSSFCRLITACPGPDQARSTQSCTSPGIGRMRLWGQVALGLGCVRTGQCMQDSS